MSNTPSPEMGDFHRNIETIYDEYFKYWGLEKRIKDLSKLYEEKKDSEVLNQINLLSAELEQAKIEDMEKIAKENGVFGRSWYDKIGSDYKPIKTYEELKEKAKNGELSFINPPELEEFDPAGKSDEDIVKYKKHLLDKQVENLGYKCIVATSKESYLTPESKGLLEHLAIVWRKKLIEKLIGKPKEKNPDQTYTEENIKSMGLMITSATRPLEKQRELQEMAGVPAAPGEESVHLLGEAFDIGPEGMLDHKSINAFKYLLEILQEWEMMGYVHVLYEAPIKAVHITRNPEYKIENGQFVRV